RRRPELPGTVRASANRRGTRWSPAARDATVSVPVAASRGCQQRGRAREPSAHRRSRGRAHGKKMTTQFFALTRRLVSVWDRFWFEPGPASRLGLARVVFCGVAFLFYWPQDFSAWGSAAPIFWMPIPLFETLHLSALSPDSLWVLQAIWKASLLLCAIGAFTR